MTDRHIDKEADTKKSCDGRRGGSVEDRKAPFSATQGFGSMMRELRWQADTQADGLWINMELILKQSVRPTNGQTDGQME